MSFKTLMMGTAIAALTAGSVLAQDATSDATDLDTNPAEAQSTQDTGLADGAAGVDAGMADAPQSLAEMTVGEVLGIPVISSEGDSIGEIDYVINQADGSPAGIIGIGGFLGLGEYTVAMPLSDFTYDAEQRALTIGRTEEELESMPEFDESEAESLPDETLVADLMQDDSQVAGASNADTSDLNADAGTATGDTEATGSADTDMAADDTATSTEDTDMASDDAATSTEDTDTAAAVGNEADTEASGSEDGATDMASEDATPAEDGTDMAAADSDTSADSTEADTDATDMASNSGSDEGLDSMSVSEAVGTKVVTDSGEEVGKLEYIVRQADNAPSAVVGIDDLVGEEKTVSLPLDKITFDSEENALRVSMTADELREAPAYDDSMAESEKLSDDTIIGDAKDGAAAQ